MNLMMNARRSDPAGQRGNDIVVRPCLRHRSQIHGRGWESAAFVQKPYTARQFIAAMDGIWRDGT
jgi:hypothetical protein